MLAILVISMAVALPKVRESIQRDRDLETMHRGKQYIRAIQLYYRKFNAYPPNVDALVKTNDIRFLRKKYIDPTTGKDVWKPVLFGQNKTPTAMGFFGQPLAGSTLAGIGPAGGNGLNGVNGNGLNGSNSTGGAFGNNNTGGAFGNNNSAFGSNNSNSAFGSNSNSAFGSNNGVAGGANGGSTDGSSNGTGSADGSNGSGSAFGGPGTGSGQTFGGAGIIGFSPGSAKQSIYVYKKKNHYNEWEFTYDPAQERMMLGGGGGNNGLGQPTPGSNTGTGAFGNPSGTFGNPSGPGGTTSPITPAPPSTPQQ